MMAIASENFIEYRGVVAAPAWLVESWLPLGALCRAWW